MKKQLLISGGAGFIGIHLIKKLIKNNYHPIVIDNFSNANIDIIKKIPKKLYTLIKTDIKKTSLILNKIEKFTPEAMIHLAAIHYIPFCIKNPDETLRINVEGTRSALKIAKVKQIRKFVFSSSAAVYKPSEKQHNENSKVLPIEIYGKTKYSSEKIIIKFCKENKINYTILRLFNVYGPHDLTPHFIPSLIKRIKQSNCIEIGNLETKRDYIYIDDLIDLLLKITKNNIILNEIFNVGTGNSMSGKEVVDLISKLKKTKIVLKKEKKLQRKNDRKLLEANIDKVKKFYHWKPKHSFSKGLKKILYEK